ncbi:MAG: hypothetical protein WAU91_18910, partial [Desulfatitalea sp.]
PIPPTQIPPDLPAAVAVAAVAASLERSAGAIGSSFDNRKLTPLANALVRMTERNPKPAGKGC